jgi:2-polyprenyl-6-methoxyphenol hydroxylase-like FAD-dependent oxidoreductase
MVEADLVIDASGCGALIPAFLDTLGWQSPKVTEIGVDISYATAVVAIPADAPDWKIALTLSDPPVLKLAAVSLPIEGARWMVLVADRGTAMRIETWDAFLAALRHLKTSTLYNSLRHAASPQTIRHYRFPSSLWRHFERLPRLPRNVLPIADAFCRFNPVYGQGMAVAAQQARLLQDALDCAVGEADPLATAQAGFMAAVASVLQTPWSMSTSADLAFPETRGTRPDTFEQSRQFEAALFRAVAEDPVVHRTFVEVGHLLQPYSRLREPDMLRRIETACAKTAACTAPAAGRQGDPHRVATASDGVFSVSRN